MLKTTFRVDIPGQVLEEAGSRKNILKKIGGGIVVFLFSLASFPFLIYYRVVSGRRSRV